MNLPFIAFLFSAGAVTLAEMGDKTQLLAMAFATKYKASKVLIGVFIATILNHGLAVALGNYIAKNQAINIWVSAIASLSFIFFGLWTIKGDKLDGEDKKTTRFGAITTVSIAFFIAELGDKTQLATIALAAKFPQNPFEILIGTTTGMLIADAIGIIIGVVMCKKIPERLIKLVSAGAFILFGILGSYQVMQEELKMDTFLTLGIISIIIIATGFCMWYLIKEGKLNYKNETAEKYCKLKINTNLR